MENKKKKKYEKPKIFSEKIMPKESNMFLTCDQCGWTCTSAKSGLPGAC